jgi:hypothetical protein
MRYRNIFFILGLSLVATLWLLTDPDNGWIQNIPFGAGLLALITTIITALVGIVFLYLIRRGMHDYPIADFEKLGIKASKEPIGAGLFAIAISIMVLAYSIIIASVLIN